MISNLVYPKCECGHSMTMHRSEGCIALLHDYQKKNVNAPICPCEKHYSKVDRNTIRKEYENRHRSLRSGS